MFRWWGFCGGRGEFNRGSGVGDDWFLGGDIKGILDCGFDRCLGFEGDFLENTLYRFGQESMIHGMGVVHD